jgi:hypothetical protein
MSIGDDADIGRQQQTFTPGGERESVNVPEFQSPGLCRRPAQEQAGAQQAAQRARDAGLSVVAPERSHG